MKKKQKLYHDHSSSWDRKSAAGRTGAAAGGAFADQERENGRGNYLYLSVKKSKERAE